MILFDRILPKRWIYLLYVVFLYSREAIDKRDEV